MTIAIEETNEREAGCDMKIAVSSSIEGKPPSWLVLLWALGQPLLIAWLVLRALQRSPKDVERRKTGEQP